MSYCPDWIFDAVAAQVANEFIGQELPLRTVAKKYADGLSEKYDTIAVEELEETAKLAILTRGMKPNGLNENDVQNLVSGFNVEWDD